MKEISCCRAEALKESDTDASQGLLADEREACTGCGGESQPVTRKTVFLMLKPECFDRVGEIKPLCTESA